MLIVRALVVVVAAATVALTASGAGAKDSTASVDGIPSKQGVYTACFAVSTGDLRVIRTGRGCRAGEQKISWNQQGPPGRTGPPGRDGKDGEDGEDGADGEDGIDGEDGFDGFDGLDGKDGKDGAPGPPGPPGSSDTQIVAGTTVSTAVDAGAGTTFETTVSCPAGKNVLGGGGQVSVSVAGQLGRAALIESYPTGKDTWKVVGAVTTTLEGGSTASISIWAVCQA